MQVQVNTDNATAGDENLSKMISALLEESLSRFSPQITRIEVHLGELGGDQSRCVIETRLENYRPIAVSNEAGSLGQAIDGCVAKMETSIESTLGRLGHRI